MKNLNIVTVLAVIVAMQFVLTASTAMAQKASADNVKPPYLGPPLELEFRTIEPHPKAVPHKLEISDVFKCFFAYSSGVMLSSAEWGLNSL